MRKAYIVEDDKDSAELVVELLSDELDVNIFSNAGDLLAFLQMSDTVPPQYFYSRHQPARDGWGDAITQNS